MRKIVLSILLIFVFEFSYSQFVNTQTIASPTTLYSSKGGLASDSATIVLGKQSFTDTTSANYSVVSKYAGVIIKTSSGSYFIRQLNPNKWIEFTTGGSNIYVKYTDTATMLTPYAHTQAVVKYYDTASMLSNRLKISDTATMLSPYARTLALGGYIPYTGATGAIDLNAKTVVNISKLGINTTTVPTILLRVIGDNSSTSRISMRGYSSDANSSSIRVTKFRGTAASPQAPLSGDGLGKFELAGYGTTSSDGYPQASFEGIATENWGATARGAKVQVKVTPNTTITQAIALTINQDKSAVFENSITGTSLIKTGGTSSQFLKADGSVDANAYLNISDTATMLSGYKTYYSRAALSAGTGITYNASTGVITNSSPSTGGTVTSITTNNGTGLTGGTITTTGTLANDTTNLSTRLWRQKGVDSLNGLISARVKYTDTASMLSPYARSYAYVPYTGATSNVDLGSRGVTAISGGFTNVAGGGYGVTLSGEFITTPKGVIRAYGENNRGSYDFRQIRGNSTGEITSAHTDSSGYWYFDYGVNLPAQTASRALVTDASKNVIVSSVTSTELGYVSGVTSAIQTQLNSKGSGTVTSVVLSTGLTGGTITTTGTAKVDTSIIATKAYVNGSSVPYVNVNKYSSGDYTPTLTPGTSGSITLGGTNTLHYSIDSIQGLVHVTGVIAVSSVSTPLGGLTMNIPSPVYNSGKYRAGFYPVASNLIALTAGSQIVCAIDAANNRIEFDLSLNGTLNAASVATYIQAGSAFFFDFFYFICPSC